MEVQFQLYCMSTKLTSADFYLSCCLQGQNDSCVRREAKWQTEGKHYLFPPPLLVRSLTFCKEGSSPPSGTICHSRRIYEGEIATGKWVGKQKSLFCPGGAWREGQRQIFDRDTGGLIVRFDLPLNLHCLWKAAMMSMMRQPLAPDKKVMSGNERQWVGEVEKGEGKKMQIM